MMMFCVLIFFFILISCSDDNSSGAVDVATDLADPNDQPSLPYSITGYCINKILHLTMFPPSTTPSNMPINILITGELELLHHYARYDMDNCNILKVKVPEWAMSGGNYVSVHALRNGVLLAKWEFIKMSELCGDDVVSHHQLVINESFNGDLPSHHE